MEKKTPEWFEDWFNTLYYHLLYKHRDDAEAGIFIENLLTYLMPRQGEKFLDLACGRGRHSVFLSNKGFDVTGLDLSAENIDYAKKFENPHLHFFVHDMRKVFRENAFDYIFNLFTSFGYFERKKENQDVVNSMQAMLKPGGHMVIDFLNPDTIRFDTIVTEEEIEGIIFKIHKKREPNRVIKEIDVIENGKSHYFREVVNLFSLDDFEIFLKNAGLECKHVFGDYQLNTFAPRSSERMILVGYKPE